MNNKRMVPPCSISVTAHSHKDVTMAPVLPGAACTSQRELLLWGKELAGGLCVCVCVCVCVGLGMRLQSKCELTVKSHFCCLDGHEI